VDPNTAFIIVWGAGAAISAAALMAARTMPPFRRIALCSLALAATIAPSIAGGHSPIIFPAIAVMLTLPFTEPHHGMLYALLFGLLPIGVVWALIVAVWLAIRKIRAVYFTRL
jgi:hypothetical protein